MLNLQITKLLGGICLISEVPVIDWEDVLDRFYSHKGTIRDFCKENNITAHQLYYRRMRAKKKDIPVFHAVNFKEKNCDISIDEETIPSNGCLTSDIKIEIGKAKIYIPSNDKTSLMNMLKAIMESC